MKMSELEALPLGTLVAVENWRLRDGAPLIGTLQSVWRTGDRKGQATIIGADGQERYAREKLIHVACDAQREAFERAKTRLAQQDAECERLAKALGIARVGVRHGRNVILRWEEAAAIVARLEAKS